MKNPLIIDTHQHLWDLKRLKLPWLDGAPAVLKQTYGPKEYADATAGLNIRSVYMEVDVAETDQDAEAEYVIGLSKLRNPMLAAVIGGRPASSRFTEYVKKHAATGVVKGVRQVLHNDNIPRGVCLADDFVRGCRTLGEHQLSFDLCMRPTELVDGAKLAGLCPNTRFIVDHCGNADPKAVRKFPGVTEKPWHEMDQWKRDMDRLAAEPNVICKISGIMARAPEGWMPEDLAPIVNHCLDTFGMQRVVFGGDWPVCLLGGKLMEWIDALTLIVNPRPEADRRALWSENAIRYYGLTV